ncbi:hypothetical protein BH11PLA2_BH11PLA2_02910 [soil metagenome]
MVSYFDLPLADKRRLDSVCVAFEEAGQESKIEDYLSHCDLSLRGTLLTELLAMELEWRRLDAGGTALDDYLVRIPDFPESVREAFGTRMPAIGSTLGKYQLTGILGHGGMGVVFNAMDTVIGRSVAIKVLPPRLMQEADSRQRLLSEARLAGQVQHPNVVTLYELGEFDGTAFLVMELVSGGTAAERIRREGAYDWHTASRIMTEVARGLCAVHNAGFLHLDIKPGNVLLMANASSGSALAKLSDFSLSMSDAATPGLTLAAGTPAYVSPEQRSSGPLTPQTDVFGFGTTFFALLTGHAPYAGSDFMTILAEQVRDPRGGRSRGG